MSLVDRRDTEDGRFRIASSQDVPDRSRAEDSQSRSERLAAIVEHCSDGIIGKTLDGIVTSWNPAAEKMFGYSNEEMLGKSVALLCPDDRTHEMAAVLAAIRSGQPIECFETTRVRKDGRIFPVSLTVSPIRNTDGVIVGASTISRDVTAARQAFEAARSMIESSLDSLVAINPQGKITDANEATVKVTGIARVELIGTAFSQCFTEPEKADRIYQLVFDEGMAVDYPLTMRHRDGSRTEVLYNASVHRDSGGKVLGVFAAARDVTAQNQAADTVRKLTAAEDLVHALMASSSIGIALTELDGRCRAVSRSLCDLLGYDEAWFLAHRIEDLSHPDDATGVLGSRGRPLTESTDTLVASLPLARSDGGTVWVRRVTVQIPGGDGQPDVLMSQMEDITAEHEAHEALTYQAFHDKLTGLHNRAWVLDMLEVDLRTAKRMGTRLGALFVDLDNFKVVNDSLGHAAGDEVLAAVSHRIAGALRPGDRVGRLGGDEFVIVLTGMRDLAEIERCADRVSSSISADLHVRGHRIVPTASIGIAVSTATSTPDSLLRDTDSALFRAKAAGRARWQFFDAAMNAQAVARRTVEDQLRDAIPRREFVVEYQPIVALADNHIVGHEALVRWAHPIRGLLSPDSFIGVAESTGLITAIDDQVLDQVCATLAECPGLAGTISVNVSAVQLATPDWLSSVEETLKRHDVDPTRIVIEVTETAVLNLIDSTRRTLTSLHGLGVGIHIDGFGTGYSSISVLRDLPVTGVKLDLRFVHDLTTGDSQNNALTQGLSGLVKGLHLNGIAEGIESQTQAEILRAQGWECGQGYYFGRPGLVTLHEPNHQRQRRGGR